MKDAMSSWPQTSAICAFAMLFIACGYLLSRMRESWGPAAWTLLALLLLCGAGFMVTVFLFYLRPQYGPRALPVALAMLCAHIALVALLWRIGAIG